MEGKARLLFGWTVDKQLLMLTPSCIDIPTQYTFNDSHFMISTLTGQEEQPWDQETCLFLTATRSPHPSQFYWWNGFDVPVGFAFADINQTRAWKDAALTRQLTLEAKSPSQRVGISRISTWKLSQKNLWSYMLPVFKSSLLMMISKLPFRRVLSHLDWPWTSKFYLSPAAIKLLLRSRGPSLSQNIIASQVIPLHSIMLVAIELCNRPRATWDCLEERPCTHLVLQYARQLGTGTPIPPNIY